MQTRKQRRKGELYSLFMVFGSGHNHIFCCCGGPHTTPAATDKLSPGIGAFKHRLGGKERFSRLWFCGARSVPQ